MAKNQPRTMQQQKKTQRRQPQKKRRSQQRAWEFPLIKKNLMILGIGLIVILIGFGLMATGITEEPAVPDGKWNNPFAVDIAPLLLLIGYCVIIPYGILKYFKGSESNKQN